MTVEQEAEGPTANQAAISEATRILDHVASTGLTARALGGIAVALRCPSAQSGVLARSYSDLDLVVDRKSAHRLTPHLEDLGYAPDVSFNAVHGRSRLMFAHAEHGHVDIFIERFTMCHTLDLKRRLRIHPTTLAPADLLLTKLQVAQLNHKDVTDAVALVTDLPLSDDEAAINADYIIGVLSSDWGWWRTVTANLALVQDHLADLPLDAAERKRVCTALEDLRSAIDRSRKSLRWRLRAPAGERLPWRDDPEETRA
jgi:hypothetical protein